MICDNDCFNCKYPDCINNETRSVEPKKRGRKPIGEELLKQHRHDYYMAHREEKAAYYKKRNAEVTKNKPYCRMMWVTDGQTNRRVNPNSIQEYLDKGWRRGRTVEWK